MTHILRINDADSFKPLLNEIYHLNPILAPRLASSYTGFPRKVYLLLFCGWRPSGSSSLSFLAEKLAGQMGLHFFGVSVPQTGWYPHLAGWFR